MNLLDIDDLSPHQINEIFELADKLKSEESAPLLSGKTFILFFPESSLRTRISFEKGIKDLGGESILFPPEALEKKEQMKDVMKYMENWSHGVIIRHPDYSRIEELSSHSSIPVINAMTSENHPCEILSDLYSISKKRASYKDLVYTFVGPQGNICKSWMNVAKVMNLKFNHVCSNGHALIHNSDNYSFHTELEGILTDSDVILTDSLPNEFRTEQYINKYQISLDRMKLTKGNSMINPCPPFFRNEEVSEDVISSDYFLGYEFKKNLIFVQQAIILYCLAR